MRIYGRTRDTLTGKKTWQVVTTDENGFNDLVYLVDLAQVCKLNLGESPFFADWGIPAHASVMTQIAPDFYVALTQQRFAVRFLSLTLWRLPDAIDDTQDDFGRPAPNYRYSVITNWGAAIANNIPI